MVVNRHFNCLSIKFPNLFAIKKYFLAIFTTRVTGSILHEMKYIILDVGLVKGTEIAQADKASAAIMSMQVCLLSVKPFRDEDTHVFHFRPSIVRRILSSGSNVILKTTVPSMS